MIPSLCLLSQWRMAYNLEQGAARVRSRRIPVPGTANPIGQHHPCPVITLDIRFISTRFGLAADICGIDGLDHKGEAVMQRFDLGKQFGGIFGGLFGGGARLRRRHCFSFSATMTYTADTQKFFFFKDFFACLFVLREYPA